MVLYEKTVRDILINLLQYMFFYGIINAELGGISTDENRLWEGKNEEVKIYEDRLGCNRCGDMSFEC